MIDFQILIIIVLLIVDIFLFNDGGEDQVVKDFEKFVKEEVVQYRMGIKIVFFVFGLDGEDDDVESIIEDNYGEEE